MELVFGLEPIIDMDVDNVTVKVTDTAILPCAIDFMGGHKVCINAILPCTIDFMGGHKVCMKAILPCTSDFIGGHKVCIKAVLPCAINFIGGHKVCIKAILSCTIDFMGGNKPCAINFMGGHKVCINAILPCAIDFIRGHNVCIKAILPCAIDFMGGHKVVWTDQWSTLLTLDDRRIIDDPRVSIVRPYKRDWNLHIWNVTYEDQGPYDCQVNSDPIHSKRVMLNVLVPSEIVDILSSRDRTVLEGSTAILVCTVTGVPTPEVSWYKLPYEGQSSARENFSDMELAWEGRTGVGGTRAGEGRTSVCGTRAWEGRTDVCGTRAAEGMTGVCGTRVAEGRTDVCGTRAAEDRTGVCGTRVAEGRTDVCGTRAAEDRTGVCGTRVAEGRTGVCGTRAAEGMTDVCGTRAVEGRTGVCGTRAREGRTDVCGTRAAENMTGVCWTRVGRAGLVLFDKGGGGQDWCLLVKDGGGQDWCLWVKDGRGQDWCLWVKDGGGLDWCFWVKDGEGRTSVCGTRTRKDRTVRPEVNMLTKHIGQYVGRDTVLYCEVVANPHGVMVDYYNGNIGTFKKTLILQIHNIQVEDFGKYVCFARNSIGQNKESMILYDYSVHDSPPTIMPETSVIEPFAKAPSKTPITQKPDDIEIPREGSGVGTDKELFLNAVTQGANRPNKPSTTLNTHKPDAIEILGQGNDNRTDGEDIYKTQINAKR
ncbi:NEGR1-like protein [Mya arenaria]|uniref:NEGR1-like protein n=1 Tax=Mya arenaria TaxID=6604 RepID=A0ABY7GAC3_MYAAR|nr:NEGR1-like protein [Mya arenaria]